MDLPGEQAQYRMAQFGRERLEASQIRQADYKRSAVMILICLDENYKLFIPLIERANYDGVHSGQISLPGGKFDKDDIDLKNTAIRECYEEIGLKDLEVLGTLSQLYIPVSGFLVQPYIAYSLIQNPQFNQQEREVKKILKLSLQSLLNDSFSKKGIINIDNQLNVKAPYYELEDKKIWGATAMILSELKELLKTTF